MRTEYDKMYERNEKYKFLCYCPEAKVGIKRIAFVAYKLLEEPVNMRQSLKRRRESLSKAAYREIKR